MDDFPHARRRSPTLLPHRRLLRRELTVFLVLSGDDLIPEDLGDLVVERERAGAPH